MNLQIRPMTSDDVSSAFAIERASAASPWSEGMFRDELAGGTGRYYAIVGSESGLLAFGGLMFVLDDAHVTNIAVDPARRRSGVATRLLLHLVHQAIARGATSLTLEVRASNTAARALYSRFGMAPAGVRKGYYPDGEDALILWVHDIDTSAYGLRLARIAEQAEAAHGLHAVEAHGGKVGPVDGGRGL